MCEVIQWIMNTNTLKTAGLRAVVLEKVKLVVTLIVIFKQSSVIY